MRRAQQLTPDEHIVEPDAFDRALVTYTSGSTGKPKGVVQSWTSVTAAIERNTKITSMSNEDQIACTAPFQLYRLSLGPLRAALFGCNLTHLLE